METNKPNQRTVQEAYQNSLDHEDDYLYAKGNETKHEYYYDRFTLELTQEQAESGSHPGPCDSDIAELLKDPDIKAQFESINPDDIRQELKGYGAWDDDELQNDDANQARILWITCGNIAEDIRAMEEESQS